MCGTRRFSTFSVKSAVGASSAPLAVDRIADSSAPKNITWAKSGVRSRIRVGRISWKRFPSASRSGFTIPGAMRNAE